MAGICDGRIAIVTGAGRGLGREYALALAREGAKVVVNDLGTGAAGEGRDATPAEAVVAEIRGFGGEAVASFDDITDFEASKRLVDSTVELKRYGITANALAPAARTRMTEQAFAAAMKKPEHGFDVNDPANVAPLVVWLASAQSAHVTGQVFETKGGLIMLAQGWRDGPAVDKGEKWVPDDVGAAVDRLLAELPAPKPVYGVPAG